MALLLTALNGIHSAYVGVTTSLLLIFTPQLCPSGGSRLCGVTENAAGDGSRVHMFLLVLNAVTLGTKKVGWLLFFFFF
jgi:hypothetical protein